jgi:exodeoxyribonuclease-5
MAPSRDEGLGAPIDVQPELKIKGFADDPGDDSVGSSLVQGGRDRGLILHKLLEEVLSRECLESEEELRRRAEHLIRQVGAEPALTPAAGLCPAELAGTVVRALELPEVAAIRDALIAEVPVYGIEEGKDGECAIFGIADAFAVSADGKPQLVIDWKSDVRPNLQATEHYRNQVRRYLEVTGIPRGLVVFVTTGEVVQVEHLHTSC